MFFFLKTGKKERKKERKNQSRAVVYAGKLILVLRIYFFLCVLRVLWWCG